MVSAIQPAEAEEVIRARAKECEAPLQFVRHDYPDRIGLEGRHQKQNAALAIAALSAGKIAIDKSSIDRGLASISWPARFQRWDERTIIDGAHNPAGAHTLAETWRENFADQGAIVILAVLRDKDIAGICSALSSIARLFLLPQILTERALPPDELKTILSQSSPGIPAAVYPSFHEAWNCAQNDSAPILITGSLHFAGEALAYLRGVPAAYEECSQ